MTIVDKLVYLMHQGIITIEQVAPEHKAGVEAALSPTGAIAT